MNVIYLVLAYPLDSGGITPTMYVAGVGILTGDISDAKKFADSWAAAGFVTDHYLDFDKPIYFKVEYFYNFS